MAGDVAFLLNLGLLAVSALLLSLLFVRLRLPVVSAEIIAGMVVGPSVLGWVTSTALIGEVANIGIVVLLFLIGLELDPAELSRMVWKVGLFTLVEMGVAFLVALLGVSFLDLHPLQAVIFAMATSITSTAIVGKVFLERGLLQRSESRMLMGLMVMEDIVAVVALVLISSLPEGGGIFPRSGLPGILETVAGGFALIMLAYMVGRFVAPPVIDHLSTYEDEFEEIPFLFAIGIGFVFGVLGAYLGYSAGVGAFMIGLAIRGKHSKFVSNRVNPIKNLLIFVFFVSMGSMIDPFPALSLWPELLLLSVLLVGGKFVGGAIVGKAMLRDRNSGMNDSRPETVGARLVPRGEFSFVIGEAALAIGLIDAALFSLIGLLVLVTTIAGPLLQRLTERAPAPALHPYKPVTDG